MDTRLKEAELKDEILLKIRNKPNFNWVIGRFIKTKFSQQDPNLIGKLIQEIFNDRLIDMLKVSSSPTMKFNPRADRFMQEGGYVQACLEKLKLEENEKRRPIRF